MATNPFPPPAPPLSVLTVLRRSEERLSAAFDHAFDASDNPWRHLGALAFLCLVVAVASGAIAYALYDTSVSGAYQSGLRLQNDPMLLGRLLRGLHRYAADALVLLTGLHLLREAVRGHYRGVRWFSWLTGAPLVWLLWIAGLTGPWLLWDSRALYSVTSTTELLQALPLAPDLLARNVLTAEALNDRFFSLIMFIHIGVPLFLLAAMWVHVQRLSRPRLWPPRSLAIGCLVTLSLLAVALPAESLGPADTGRVSANQSIDWFYQFPHPLADIASATAAWLLAFAFTALVIALAVVPRMLRRGATRSASHPHLHPVAQVNLANCNGCSRCAADCPFGAVEMVARTDQRRHPRQASVIADLCAGCGICAGACPSSTPFRRIEDMVSGIEMPGARIASLREELKRGLASLDGPNRVVVFACRNAADHAALRNSSTLLMRFECAAMLPPSFIEFAGRLGATGTVIAGCREGDCEYRLGDQWVQQRLSGAREPHLRAVVSRDRLHVIWSGQDIAQVQAAVASLRGGMSGKSSNQASDKGTERVTHSSETHHD